MCFFGPIGKTRWPPWPLIGLDIFDFSSETAERNSTRLDRKQDLNVLYQVCFFGPISKQKCLPWLIPQKWGTLYSGADMWPFGPLVWLLLWNHCKEFKETWQEGRSKHPVPSLCFSERWINKNGCPSRSVKKVAHCTQVHDMWPFGPLVFGLFWKTRWPPLVSHLLWHFQLFLSNRWTEFNETWLEARSQHPLLSLCFWADLYTKN